MAKSNESKAVGRPTSYRPEYNEQVFKLCLLRATNEEIANFFEVNVDTIHEWKKQHPEFSDAISRGKEKADMEIVNKLFHRANGMTVKKKIPMKVKVDQYKEEIQIIEVDEVHPPDITAIRFWLTNRNATGWKDKQVVETNHTFAGKAVESFLDQFRDVE
jgi:hypothetical protein